MLGEIFQWLGLAPAAVPKVCWGPGDASSSCGPGINQLWPWDEITPIVGEE